MKLSILGSGTSMGVPRIGCSCNVCLSNDPKDNRTRASLLITHNRKNILIDTSIDFRIQALRHNIKRLDAVLFTHHHADHIHGIDDLRAFNLMQKREIPCYSSPATIKRMKILFRYIFEKGSYNGLKPELKVIKATRPFKLYGVNIIPIKVRHGNITILGFRLNDVAYITDCSFIPAASLKLLDGLKVLIIGALRREPHPSHFSIDQAIEVSRGLMPRRTILTHLGHEFDYKKDNPGLPRAVEFAYDGMEIKV
ncbi:MAG: MBL fold metallo-hydrolase [Deltaproteobacteria bacterium]|nr:MBL fold metallo-hydrolase [Deltaproteobacteria bacterium]